MQSVQARRYTALDGVRGAAALVVVIHHFVCCFAPQFISALSRYVPPWVDSPLGLAIHGGFAVSVFFVLSGFVLAASCDRSNTPLWFAVPTRWLRLAVPAALSTLMGWGLLCAMPEAATALAKHLPSPWHAYVYQGAIPSLGKALVEGLFFQVFATPGPGAFNNVLWTMKFEFLGSVSIYAFYSLMPRERRVLGLVLLVLAAAGFGIPAPFFAFLLGALIFEASKIPVELTPWTLAAIVIAGLLLASPTPGFTERWRGGSLPTILSPGHPDSFLGPLGASLLIFAVTHSKRLSRTFDTRPLQWLGKVSFPLYLIHVPILYTVVALIVTTFSLYSPAGLLLVFAGFLMLSLALAGLLDRAVDRPLLIVLARVKQSIVHGHSGRMVANAL